LDFSTGSQTVTVAWSINPGATYTPPPGGQCMDIMGNPLAEKDIALGESPIYVVKSISN
jgi:hypothetical protein